MTAIFISHRSCDNAEADALKGWLAEQGHERLFLDFDPADGIPAGVDWEQRLYQELRRCQALLIVLTPAWLESKWCGNELAIAREKGKAVFVVRVKPCPAGPLIPAIQEVDLTLDRDAGLEKLARGLREHGLDPRDAFDWKPDRPIYPGLAAYDVDDAAIFFGRSEESWQTIEALRRMRVQATGSPKLLLITGASGSGKSSLMRAGVLARLRKEPASWITARPFRRGANALGALADALAWAFPPDRRPTSLETLTSRLTGPDGAGQLLTLARELRLALDRPEATLVLALDQAEELLAAEREDDAARLLDLFRATLTVVGSEILVITTIRSDRLGVWQQHGSIKATAEHGELPFEMLPLGPMPMARIGEIVRGPAAYEDLRIDDDLVDAIRADTVTPDALPLLAYTLQYLHRHFAADGHLTLPDYRSFGGLEGSVRSQADAAIPIDRLSEEDRRALQEAFVPGLVRATAQGGFSRSRALLASLPPRAEPYLRRLIDEARLLTTDTDPQGGVTVEVAHESLLRVWPTLERWIAEDAESLRRLEAMQRAAQDWAQGGHGDDFLIHRDHRLSDAEQLVAEPRFAARLDNPDRDYLAACRNAQNQREAADQQERERRIRDAERMTAAQKKIARTTTMGLLVALALTGLAVWQYRVAVKAEADAVEQADLAQEQRAEAERQLERANAALAIGLWNNLDFADGASLAPAEREALWTLAVDDGLVRAPFVAELSANAERMQRFARRPGPVLRALGFAGPSPQQARKALGPVLDAIEGTTDPDQLVDLSEAVKALAAQLDGAQAQAVLGPVLDAIQGTTDPYQLWVLTKAVQALPVQLDAVQAQAALGPVLDAIRVRGTNEPGALRELEEAVQQALAGELDAAQAQAVLGQIAAIKGKTDPRALQVLMAALQALAGKLSAEQVRDALGPVLAATEGAIDPDQLDDLSEAVKTLAGELDAAQAQAALGPILNAIKNTTDPDQLLVLAEVVQALAVQLDAGQARAALAPVLTAIKGATRPHKLLTLAKAVQALPVQLDAGQAQAALGPVLDAIKRTSDPDELRTLAEAVQTLPVQLDAGQAQAALGPVLGAIKGTNRPDQLLALAEAVQALPVELDAGQAEAALGPVLGAIKGTDSPWVLRELAEAVKALPVQLDAAQAQAALAPVLTGIVDADVLLVQALAEAVQALAGKLSAEQAREALDPVLDAIKGNTGGRLEALAETVKALTGRLDAAQAQAALGLVLDAIEGTTDPDQLLALAEAVQALPVELDAGQAEAALGPVLHAIKDTTRWDRWELQQLAGAVKALAGKLDAVQAQAALKIARRGLAWAQTSDEAAGWAAAHVTLLPREKPEIYVEKIVEALKYPTSAGAATDVLLDGLHRNDPNAPGKEAGLAANLAWLRTAYPAIDLEAPPACPEPLSDLQDVSCPKSGI